MAIGKWFKKSKTHHEGSRFSFTLLYRARGVLAYVYGPLERGACGPSTSTARTDTLIGQPPRRPHNKEIALLTSRDHKTTHACNNNLSTAGRTMTGAFDCRIFTRHFETQLHGL